MKYSVYTWDLVPSSQHPCCFKVFQITTSARVRNVQFKLTELPNNIKILAFLVANVSNTATYFCTFSNVKLDEASDCQKTFGEVVGNYRKPFAL